MIPLLIQSIKIETLKILIEKNIELILMKSNNFGDFNPNCTKAMIVF